MAEENSSRPHLLAVIVDWGKGSKVLSCARGTGISGGTILLGRGTVDAERLGWLDFREIRKEVVLIFAGDRDARTGLLAIAEEFSLEKRNHGIAFLVAVDAILGTKHCRMDANAVQGTEDNSMYKMLFVVVDKGVAETVTDAAKNAGAGGATIMNARGAGAYETKRLFNMDIEPEKEVVMFIVPATIAGRVAEAIIEAADLNKPGTGILSVLDVETAVGLYEKKP